MTIPPDLDSCTQHILRSHLVAFKWINFDKMIMPNINPYENGWKLAGNNTFSRFGLLAHNYPLHTQNKDQKNRH